MNELLAILMSVMISSSNISYERTTTWEPAVTSGDCKNITMSNYQKAKSLGVDADKMSISVVRLHSGIIHAVLLVDSGEKTYVVDSRRRNPVEKSAVKVARWIYEKNPETGKISKARP